jgi:hypothetical protein
MTDLTTWTPVEVDTALAAIYVRGYEQQYKVQRLTQAVEQYAAGVAKGEAGDLRYSTYRPERLDDMTARLTEARRLLAETWAETAPYDAEFVRRGGWTRAWKVTNTNGHVHSTMQCQTCYPTTEFGWLPQVSGMNEAEIVDLAGESACTVCYPTAPVAALGRPTRLWTAAEREAYDTRKAEREARAAAKAAKSLSVDGAPVKLVWTYETSGYVTQPDGTAKWVPGGVERRAWKELKTYRAAELFVVGGLAGTDSDHPTREVLNEVVGLMATKRGVTVEEILAGLAPRVAKKRVPGSRTRPTLEGG